MKTSDISGPVDSQEVNPAPLKKTAPKVKKVKAFVVSEDLWDRNDAEAIIAQNMKEVLAYLKKYGSKGKKGARVRK